MNHQAKKSDECSLRGKGRRMEKKEDSALLESGYRLANRVVDG